ncbi:D-glycero-beta-D-manno-heptose-1,7-bisphosphate 7-phosphatase [Photobacterium gaetbulicola]|uniref:D,D-heptose 1,7-bisphosphate phosphatase n=1 Tax=Photobacterium gaetbulicola Gung47 TaxID=658445 RepID=A0A0C5WH33_9GAMM|nr:HAD-IIIA family hydrolase [Photobacterium gaetbulicola]AJR05497.1 putative histidinol-phosphate phosphatase family protein [Photobacterium gaetbulicola Gung47]PST99762.1 D-glycero-beta-D-manno-heptose-1,7-bisphosphate 7-phosphatase [Photobacterium gaetbulicola]
MIHIPGGKSGTTKNAAVFLDRDGVINENRDNYVLDEGDITIIDGSAKAIERMIEFGYQIIIVTNQQCVGKGIIKREKAKDINHEVIRRLGLLQPITATYFCPHLATDLCECRKPNPGMILTAAQQYEIDLCKSFFIGDADTDVKAARNAGVKPILVLTGRGKQSLSLIDRTQAEQLIIENDLAAAANFILEQ